MYLSPGPYSRTTAPVRSKRGRRLQYRPLYLSAKLEDLAEPQRQQGPAHGKRDGYPALSLPRGSATGFARDAPPRSVGLQFRSHDPHVGNAHLPATPEGGEGRRNAGNSCDRSRRLQAGPLKMTPQTGTPSQKIHLERDEFFLDLPPALALCMSIIFCPKGACSSSIAFAAGFSKVMPRRGSYEKLVSF